MSGLNTELKRASSAFQDETGHRPVRLIPAAPFLVTKEEIDAEIARLSAIDRPENGWRSSAIRRLEDTWSRSGGLTPTTKVSLNVLLPGESTIPRRANSNQIEICITGSGIVKVGKREISPKQHDVWNLPPMEVIAYKNDGALPWVRLTYSNEALLSYLEAYFIEEGDQIGAEETVHNVSDRPDGEPAAQTFTRANAPDIAMGNEGARLRGYEYLTDIEFVEPKALIWRWDQIKGHMPVHPDDGKRHIWLMYDPQTKRRNGTSPCYFATWAGAAAGTKPLKEHRGHRHISASINYHTGGSGRSVVDGAEVNWKAGDLLFSAPTWSEHTHYPGSDGWTILTVQDHPLHIAIGSLLWQERMDGKIFSLGQEPGQTGFTAPREVGT